MSVRGVVDLDEMRNDGTVIDTKVVQVKVRNWLISLIIIKLISVKTLVIVVS